MKAFPYRLVPSPGATPFRGGTRSRPLAATVLAATAVLALVWSAPAAGQNPTSGSFVLSQSTVNNAGASAVSSSFVLDGSAAQESTVGEATSTSFRLQSGFWTSLSTLDVLRVAAAGSGAGSAAAAGITCVLDGGAVSGDCTEHVTDGTTVEIVAAPAPANRFDGWSGCDSTSTTALAGDTCRVRLIESRTATAGLTLLGTVGDRVWRDYDGDGTQDAGEPGITGVELTLDDGAGFTAATTTASGGAYDFTDVPPGTYTLSIDTATLPPGVFASFDPDGIGTPHTATVGLTDGQDLNAADFGYHPVADLALTKVASVPSLPENGSLTYALTVENLGPAGATGVTVVDHLPAGLTLVATSGCAEDPVGVPSCILGDLAPGTKRSYTIEVTADPYAQPSFSNTATVAAAESDPNGTNDVDTVRTQATPVVEIPVAGLPGLLLFALLLAGLGGWLLPGRSG